MSYFNELFYKYLNKNLKPYLKKNNPDLLNLRLKPAKGYEEQSNIEHMFIDPIDKEWDKRIDDLLFNDPVLNKLIKKTLEENDDTLKDYGILINLSNCGKLKAGDIIKARSQGQQKYVVIKVEKEWVSAQFRGESGHQWTKYPLVPLEKIKDYEKEDVQFLHKIVEEEKYKWESHRKGLFVYLCGHIEQKVSWGSNV